MTRRWRTEIGSPARQWKEEEENGRWYGGGEGGGGVEGCATTVAKR